MATVGAAGGAGLAARSNVRRRRRDRRRCRRGRDPPVAALADHKGRLRFTDYGEGRFAGTSLAALQAWVDAHRVAELAAASSPVAEALATRPLAIGDVFAATTHAEGAGVTPESLLGADFVDLAIDAREAAKLAFYGAVGRSPRTRRRAGSTCTRRTTSRRPRRGRPCPCR